MPASSDIRTSLNEGGIRTNLEAIVADIRVVTEENVVDYWMSLLQFVLAFALLATITLEFIDKDKR